MIPLPPPKPGKPGENVPPLITKGALIVPVPLRVPIGPLETNEGVPEKIALPGPLTVEFKINAAGVGLNAPPPAPCAARVSVNPFKLTGLFKISELVSPSGVVKSNEGESEKA